MKYRAAWFLCLMLVVLVGCRSGPEELESRYADLVAADDDGARGRGWIPRFVPASARDIIERHNIETNEIWLTFRKDEKELGGIADRCEEIPAAEVLWPARVPDWWPETLRGEGGGEEARLLRCSVPHKMGGVRFRRVGYMSLSASGDQVWYWETSPAS